MRSGIGFDVHPFDESRELVLGGVLIDGHAGLKGHSDADVVAHAITDAILGAAGLGDMGEHFPDTDEQWRGADSIEMLRTAVSHVKDAGFTVANADCTVIIERPKLAPHRAMMQKNLSDVVGAQVTVKASRAEGLGALGRVEGAACFAVALLVER